MMKITYKEVGLGIAIFGVGYKIAEYFDNLKQRRLVQDHLTNDAINGQRHDYAVENTDESYLIDFDVHNEPDALRIIKDNIDEIMMWYSCLYIGASEYKYRLETHEEGRFQKAFLLAETTDFSKIKEIEEYFIRDTRLTIIIDELAVNLTNKTDKSKGLKPGATKYYLYIAVC